VNFLIMFAIQLALSTAAYLLTPKPKPPSATAGKLDVPTAQEGGSVPVVFGTVLLKSPNIVDWFAPGTKAIRKKV